MLSWACIAHLIPCTTIPSTHGYSLHKKLFFTSYRCFLQNKIALSSCPTDVLDKSWLPCWCWFFKKRFLKLFLKEAHRKTLDPKCSDPIDLWTTFWTNLNPNLQRIISDTVVSERQPHIILVSFIIYGSDLL